MLFKILAWANILQSCSQGKKIKEKKAFFFAYQKTIFKQKQDIFAANEDKLKIKKSKRKSRQKLKQNKIAK